MKRSPSLLERFFTPPQVDDSERQRTANMLHAILVGSVVIMVAVIATTALTTPAPALVLTLEGLLLVGAWIGLWLIRSGHVKVVSVGFTALSWLIVTLTAVLFGGIHAPSLIGYPVVVLMAGFFLGRRQAVAVALVSVLAAAGLGLAETAELLPDRLPTSFPLWMGIAGGLAAVALFTHLAVVADEDRRATAARLRLALEAGHVGTWEWDNESDGVVWSDNVDAIVGRRRASLDGRFPSYLDLVHDQDRVMVERALRDTIERGVPFEIDHRITRPEGKVTWVAGRGEVSAFQGSQAGRIVGTITDITERRASQRALERSAQQLARAQRLARLGSWDWHVEENTVAWSPEFRRMYALGDAAPSMEVFRTRFHPDDAERVDRAVAKTLETGEPMELHHRVVRPDGSEGEIHVRGELLRDDPDGAVHMVGFAQDLTELYETQAALRRQVETNQQLLETTLDGYLLTDTKGDIRDVNPAYVAMSGYSCEQLQNMSIGELDAGFTREEFTALVERLGREGAEQFETQHRTREGRVIDLDIAVVLLDATDGPAVAAFMRNTTDRRRAAQALRESEEKYRALFEASPVGIGVGTQDGTILAFNDAILEPSDRERGDITPTTKVDDLYYDTADIPRVRELLEQQGFVRNEEVRFKRKDGGFYEASLNVNPVVVDGKPCTLAIVQDISARKKAERELQRSEERFRAVYEQAAISIVQAEPDGRFMNANQRFCELLGYNEAQLKNMRLQDVTHPDDAAADDANLEAALSGAQSTFLVEKRYIRADSSVVWAELSAKLITDTDGGSPYWIGAITDVTQRKRAEEALWRANRALRVGSRCNEAVIHAGDEESLLQDVCRALVDVGGYRMAWVGMAKNDTAKTIEPVAWEGHEAGYFETLAITWADDARGQGPTGSAVRTGRTVVCRDIQSDPQFAPWRADAERRGHQSSIALPLILDDQPLGALNVYAHEASAFDTDEVQLLEDATRELVHGIETLRVRTQREDAAMALQEREERFRQALSAADAGAWEWDIQTNTVVWSDENFKLLGLDPKSDRPSYERWLSCVHPDDKARVESAIQWAVEQRSDLNMEFRIILPDGTERWITDVGRIRLNEHGQPIAMFGIQIDITERKRIEEALRSSEERTSKAFDLCPDAITITSLEDGSLVAVNEAFTTLSGYEVPEALDRTTVELGIWESEAARDAWVSHVLSERRVREESLRLRTKDCDVRTCLVSAEIIDLEERSHLLTYTRDVTERLETEEAVRRSREQLRLLAARLQAVREDERTTIAREIHDEFGQALTGIKMDLSWLVQRFPKTWKRAHERAEALQQLVDETIDSVRELSARLRPSVLDDLGLGAAVEWLTQDVERRSGIKTKVTVRLEGAVLDKDQSTALFRILQEALTNVVRHAEAQHVDVRIERTDRQVSLEVKDDGQGLRGDELESGKSLGLIGMRERAGALGGRVTLGSGPKGGTTVTAWVPLRSHTGAA
jgi:PAS domain S-box-containing protein